MPNYSELANAIRALSIDAIQKANSGHPGMPLGMADIATVLWHDFLRHNPQDPNWPNRDRFVLSNGHGSMLLYSLLHLTGYDLSIDDLKNFRQLHSKTPGHPELHQTPGVETTTGPLGQGLAMAVGMALAEKILAAQFNAEDQKIIDHYTYVFCGDGCLMEGISHEACSLAGTLGLGKLIIFYDDNGISIDGETKNWFTENVAERFQAYDWHVIDIVNGHDSQAIRKAIIAAQQITDRPSLICCQTTIGFGSPKLSGTAKCHGAPLGEEEVAATRKQLGWSDAPFVIPKEIYSEWSAKDKGVALQQEWQKQFTAYKQANATKAQELQRRLAGDLPTNWAKAVTILLRQQLQQTVSLATRKASQACITAIFEVLPELFGGSADLSGSNNTLWPKARAVSKDNPNGNYLYYGVREFAMFAMLNGLSLHGGFLPFGGTFLVFSDYGRNAIRLAAMMKQRVIFVLSHDSIGLGEDGPTHQPIEHLTMLRATPNLTVWRPADAVETAVAWQMAIEQQHGPSCLVLSRQNLIGSQHSQQQLAEIKRGGYVALDCQGDPAAIIIATGSELELAIQAAERLQAEGKAVRVVSMPSAEVFAAQNQAYREEVLPAKVRARVAVEAAHPDYWRKFVGLDGKVIGIQVFGESAPYQEIFAVFGIKVDNIARAVNELLPKA